MISLQKSETRNTLATRSSRTGHCVSIAASERKGNETNDTFASTFENTKVTKSARDLKRLPSRISLVLWINQSKVWIRGLARVFPSPTAANRWLYKRFVLRKHRDREQVPEGVFLFFFFFFFANSQRALLFTLTWGAERWYLCLANNGRALEAVWITASPTGSSG